jgi:hypothetical protein
VDFLREGVRVRTQALMELEVRGEVAFERGAYAEADRLWQESLAGYHDLSRSIGIVTVENFLGQLAMRLGDAAPARARYQASLRHQQGWPALYWAIGSLAGLAAVAAASAALGDAAALRVSVAERAAMERVVRAATALLGARVAGEAWAAGQALTLEEAIAEALGGEG